MLSFSTEFPVEETSATAFCHSVATWLSGSPHTAIAEDDVLSVFTSDETSWENEGERISCVLNEIEGRSSAAFRYSKRDNGVDWITTVCFDANEVDSWVSVRTERNSETALPYIPPAKKPFVIRNLISELTGGVDGELRVQDRPHVLSYTDINMAVRLMNGDADHHLPFVYLSMPFEERHEIDHEALSRHLCGLAHVVVEPSREFSRELQPHVFSQNPYGGYIGIAFTSGDWIRIDPWQFDSEFEVRKEIFSLVRNSLLNRRQMPRCSWANIRALAARKRRVESEKEMSAAEYAAEFDKELEAKDEQIKEAESEIERLRAQLLGIRKAESIQKSGISLQVSKEQELENQEFQEVIIDAVKQYRAAVEDDTRRSHILDDVLASNKHPQRLSEKRESLKKLLRGYRNLDAALRQKIEAIGFSISEDGKHYKLIYRGDPRYQYILSKSSSDNRAGLNAATRISRLFF